MAGSDTKKIDGVVGRVDLLRVDPRQIHIRDGWNPRQDLKLGDLAASIREHGVITPVRVRRTDSGLELVDGERRLRATLTLIEGGTDIRSIPAILERQKTSDADLLVTTLIANQGEPLTPFEEGETFRRLLAYGWVSADIARRVGKSPSYVSARLTLLAASPEVRGAAGVDISVRDAVDIVRHTGNQEDQIARLEKVKNEKKAAKSAGRPRSQALTMKETIWQYLDIYGVEDVERIIEEWQCAHLRVSDESVGAIVGA